MRGLSTRQYGPVVRRFADAYGIEKSVVSEQFIEASRQKLRELIERPAWKSEVVRRDDRRLRGLGPFIGIELVCDRQTRGPAPS